MKSCSDCGCDNEDDAILCRKCGTAKFVVATSLTAPLESESSQPAEAAKASVEFIRLFFKSPAEEECALRCARCVASMVGERIADLRPDTKWSEIFQWVARTPAHTVAFVFALKKEFGAAGKALIADPDAMTFREFVEYVCSPDHNAA